MALMAPRASARAGTITRSSGSAEATWATGGAPTPRTTGTARAGRPSRVVPASIAALTTGSTVGAAVAPGATSARTPAPPPGIGEAARPIAGTARAGTGPPGPAGAAVRRAAGPGGRRRTHP